MLTKKFYKTKDEAEVTFEFGCDDVSSVALVAEFNDWQPMEMSYSKKLKVFPAKVRLPKDNDFHFRYLINNNKVKTNEGLITIETGLQNLELIEVRSGITKNTYIYKPEND